MHSNSSAMHENIDSAKALDRLPDGGINLRALTNIGAAEEHLMTVITQFLSGRSPHLFIDIDDHTLRALLDEAAQDDIADTPSRAADHRDFAVKCSQVCTLPL
jgi:hypothetical protein